MNCSCTHPKQAPSMPNNGTHVEGMLVAIAAAYPDTSWNPRYSRMKGHSRVSDLRRLDWCIEAVSRPNPYGKGSQWGYRMLTHRKHWPAALKRLLDANPAAAQQTELEVVA